MLKLTTEQKLVQSLQPTDGYKLMFFQTGSLNREEKSVYFRRFRHVTGYPALKGEDNEVYIVVKCHGLNDQNTHTLPINP